MKFIKADELKTGMRLAKPIYNKNGVMLYERNSRLTSQGIISVQNFGLIGVYILEPAEPVPPMSEDDVEFERFQAMSIFSVKDILDAISKEKESKDLYPFANSVIKKYGNLHHKINFVQNLRSGEDATYKHALNVAILSALITKKQKVDFKEQLDIVVAGILYDIGSLLIPLRLRKKFSTELTPDDLEKITACHANGYQILNKDYNMDPNVRRYATLTAKELYQIKPENDIQTNIKLPGVEILKVAAAYDNMTAMKYGEEPHSEIMALRFLLDKENGFDPKAVQGLVDSVNILNPGVCVELSNGDRGLVIAEGATNVLEPFILSFRDNSILNMSDKQTSKDIQIVDIMKTMDNRHVVDKNMLSKYSGETVHIGQKLEKKHL